MANVALIWSLGQILWKMHRKCLKCPSSSTLWEWTPIRIHHGKITEIPSSACWFVQINIMSVVFLILHCSGNSACLICRVSMWFQFCLDYWLDLSVYINTWKESNFNPVTFPSFNQVSTLWLLTILPCLTMIYQLFGLESFVLPHFVVCLCVLILYLNWVLTHSGDFNSLMKPRVGLYRTA